jgi:hypothetical protein
MRHFVDDRGDIASFETVLVEIASQSDAVMNYWFAQRFISTV